jgi:hypothetical protein
MKLIILFNINLDSRPGDVSNIPKLEDAKLAGTKDSEKCTLILTEGDSAKLFVVSCLSLATFFSLNRSTFGISLKKNMCQHHMDKFGVYLL